MSAIYNFDFQKENNYILRKKGIWATQKRHNLYVTIAFSLKQGQTRKSSESITLTLR